MSTRPKRRPKPVRIPMTTGLHQLFAEQLHISMAALRMAPHRDHFDAVATLLNITVLALEGRSGFAAEARAVSSGARAMNDIQEKVAAIQDGAPVILRKYELRPIELAVSAADAVIARLSVNDIELARRRLATIQAQDAAQKAQKAAQKGIL